MPDEESTETEQSEWGEGYENGLVDGAKIAVATAALDRAIGSFAGQPAPLSEILNRAKQFADFIKEATTSE